MKSAWIGQETWQKRRHCTVWSAHLWVKLRFSISYTSARWRFPSCSLTCYVMWSACEVRGVQGWIRHQTGSLGRMLEDALTPILFKEALFISSALLLIPLMSTGRWGADPSTDCHLSSVSRLFCLLPFLFVFDERDINKGFTSLFLILWCHKLLQWCVLNTSISFWDVSLDCASSDRTGTLNLP